MTEDRIGKAGASAPADLALTPKGERYARAQENNRDYFARLAKLRREAEAEIDRLLAFLDQLDGNPDFEDDGSDEPALGWAGAGIGRAVTGGLGDGDEEPSLGWTEGTRQDGNQWLGDAISSHPLHIDAEGDTADDEDGGDLEADTSDVEPGLGWTTTTRQEGLDWHGREGALDPLRPTRRKL